LLVLERGTVTRLGDSRPRSAAPKLVAATHADLAHLVSEGRFRQDLYMRLNPATRLRVPPLRERKEDLPDLIRFALLDALRSEQLRPLVRAYLARFPTPDDYAEEANSVHFGKPQGRAQRHDAFSIFLPQGALHRLSAHPWPGNHRELKLLATNALVFSLVQHLDADVPPLPAAGRRRRHPRARRPCSRSRMRSSIACSASPPRCGLLRRLDLSSPDPPATAGWRSRSSRAGASRRSLPRWSANI